MRLTIVGARSFIGAVVAAAARGRDHEVVVTPHDQIPDGDLGVVVYCSGIPWGADAQPREAFRLHVSAPLEWLDTRRFERLIYLSSARVYDRSASTHEDTTLATLPSDAQSVYVASKIAGEAAMLECSERTIVLRPSNVFGANLESHVFLSDIIRQAVTTGRMTIRTALWSSKDYVDVHEVAYVILKIAAASRHRVYNVASGRNTTHQAIVERIAALVPAEVSVERDAPVVVAPAIDVNRICEEFDFRPSDLIAALPDIVKAFQAAAGGRTQKR
ncbi:MAG TPA: NAD(P)-dependent oxidoreductase [Candidatus Acidoferrales bacterium]|nr:NAD(P)-dependent oxidoreductase [Candidatus Acidoferrales bacterium]